MQAIDDLLQKKRAAPELGLSPQVPAIHQFVEAELARLEAIAPVRDDRSTPLPLLNAMFHAVLS